MSSRAVAVTVAALLLATGCADGDAGGPPPPGETAAPTSAEDGPIPVEGDGGIGGEGGGPVTSSLILSADQVEVTGPCVAASDPPTYRLDLVGGGVLTVETGSPGSVELVRGGATFRSPEDQPPVVSPSEGAISVQGRVTSDAGEEFVDAVIGLEELSDC